MSLLSVIGLLAVLLGFRLGFLWLNLSDFEQLWYDFERRGIRFKLAWILDLATLGFFFGVAAWTVFRIGDLDWPFIRLFVTFGGLSLLSRLQVHRFPQTNLPGAFDEAKIDLIVHLIMASLSGLGIALVGAAYLWWERS